jgi:FLVCR family MFS transporter 7
MENTKNLETAYKVFPIRWMMLALLIPVIVASEICWLTFAPVSSYAQTFFHASVLDIDLFAMSYFLMYIVFTLPASWVIEKFGFKTSVIIGAALTAVFAAVRYFFASDYTVVIIAQFLLAAGQPFLVNISTKVPANWFPVKERATASGLLVMAQYLGFIIPMIISPMLVGSKEDIAKMLGIYAIIALCCGVLACFAREKPPIPPGPEAPKESMSLKNMVGLFKNKNFVRVLIVSFLAMGIFNTLMTMIEKIFIPKGFSSADAGFVGAVFVVAGIIGAVVLPLISDKTRVRTPFLIAGVSLMGVLIVGLTVLLSYGWLLCVAGLLGFVIMGLAPILFQHGAEVAYPVQEGASFGTIMMMGQISGVLFVVLFDLVQGALNSIVWPMLILTVLSLVQIPVAARMKESALQKK